MKLFWCGIILFSLIVVMVIAIPLVKQINWRKAHRQQINIKLYQTQLEQYPYLAEEMAQRLLQDEQYSAQTKQITAVDFNKVFALILCLALLIPSLTYYFSLDRYSQALQGKQQHTLELQQLAQRDSQQKNDQHLITVQNRLRQNPNDSESWYQLGQLYLFNNQFANALEAFSRSARLAGKRPHILSAMATAYYYQAGQRITPQVQQLIDQALQQDPLDTAALSLLAADAFLQTDYPQAMILWQKILDSGRTTAERRSIIQSMQMAEKLQQAKGR